MLTFILPLAAFYLEPIVDDSSDSGEVQTHIVIEQIHQEEIQNKK